MPKPYSIRSRIVRDKGGAALFFALLVTFSPSPGFSSPINTDGEFPSNQQKISNNNPEIWSEINEVTGKIDKLESEGHFQEAISIGKSLLEEIVRRYGNEEYAAAIGLRIAMLYARHGGSPDLGEQLLMKTIEIWNRKSGQSNFVTAFLSLELAQIYSNNGNRGRAIALIKTSLDLLSKERASNQSKGLVSWAQRMLVKTYIETGNNEKATKLAKENLSNIEAEFGKDDPRLNGSLSTLAEALSAQRKFADAETILLRSLRILESKFGKNCTNCLIVKLELGRLYTSSKAYPKAIDLIDSTFKRIKHLGLKDDQLVVNTAFQKALSDAYYGEHLNSKGDYYLSKSMDAARTILGDNSTTLTNSEIQLALSYLKQQRAADALRLLDKALPRKILSTRDESAFMPIDWRIGLTKQSDLLHPLWLVNTLVGKLPNAKSLAFEANLNIRGLLQDIERQQTLRAEASNSQKDMIHKIAELTKNINRIDTLRLDREKQRDNRADLEIQLYRDLPQLKTQYVKIPELANSLPKDAVLVEFQKYKYYQARDATGIRWSPSNYLAMALGSNGKIDVVQLGEAKRIDDAIHHALNATARNDSDSSQLWRNVSRLLLDPLKSLLTGHKQWFISPDGELNRVPFAALPSPINPSEIVGSEVHLRLLTTGRELIRLEQEPVTGQSPVVIANPNFDRPQLSTSRSTPLNGTQEQQRSSAIGTERWNPLPRTEQEGQQVAKLLSTNPITWDQATTTRLQATNGPRVLHVATHGFFAADQVSQPNDPLRSFQETGRQIQGFKGEDPLLQSGLVLAGANQPDADPNDDGYLTASEATKLQLEGTELVVLSACSTGQGDIRSGEGVYGLQRALTVAGARSTILSLWKVDDAATAEFMTRFYERLKAGEARSDALAATQKEFRDGQVRDPRSKLLWDRHYYWAAWQLVGDWRPIKDL